MSDVTQILSAIEQGDQKASEQLLPLVYAEQRKLAPQKMSQVECQVRNTAVWATEFDIRSGLSKERVFAQAASNVKNGRITALSLNV